MFGAGSSIQLARIFGIRFGVDVSWFIVLFLIIWSLTGYYEDVAPDSNAFLLAVVSALLFFLSILLHELGHAVVAIRNGIPILGIDLMLFGGVAKLGKDADSPGVEFRVAAAGPAVTVLIAAVCLGLGALVSGMSDAFSSAQFDEDVQGATTAVLGYLASINILLLLFNLIPAFPLDGGRIARAIAWKLTGDRNRATRFAARLGRLGGYIMIGVGVYLFARDDVISGVWLAFIGFFLAGAARSAEVQADFAGRIEHIRVADVMDAEPVAILDSTRRSPMPSIRSSSGMAGRGSRSSIERQARRGRVAGAVESVPWRSALHAAGVVGHGARRRVERPARAGRGAAREPARPGGTGAARGDDGGGPRRRAARDRHGRRRATSAAGSGACVRSC